MEVKSAHLPGVVLLKPRRFADARGYFVEAYSERSFRDAGIDCRFVQDNQSYSKRIGTIRALHFQLPPHPQAKLVRVLRGAILDVAVDLRVGSPTFGQSYAARLSAEGGEQLFLPRGIAHGFCTLEPQTEVAYKVDEFYAPACDSGIAWNDPSLAIAWPVADGEAMVSDKDRTLGSFDQFKSPFRYDKAAHV